MFRRSPEAGVLYIENDFHGSGVNRIDSCLSFPEEKSKRWGLFRYSCFNNHHIFYSGEVSKKPERTLVGEPAALRSPTNAQGSWTGSIVILTLERRDGIGGQALSTPSPYRCFLFHFLINEFTRAIFNNS